MVFQLTSSQSEPTDAWRKKLAVTLLALAFGGPGRAQDTKPLVLPSGEPILEFAFSPKMDMIAVQQKKLDQDVHVYDFPSMRLRGEVGRSWGGMQFSPCGKYLVLDASLERAGAISIWDVSGKTPKKLKLLWQKKEEVDILDDRVYGWPFFSPDSKQIRVLAGRRIFQWDWQESYIAKVSWPLASGDLGSSLLSFDTILKLRGNRLKDTPGQIDSFDGKAFKKLCELDSRLWNAHREALSHDGKTIVFFDLQDRNILVMDLTTPKSKLVDQISDTWLAKEEQNHKLCHGPIPHVLADRSVVIVYYGLQAGCPPIERQGFGFFPRTKEKFKEFGLDMKKHTHLFLPVPKSVNAPPRVEVSPDGRWFALTEVDLPPRIWEVKTLGKALLAEKNVIKK